MTTIAYKDGIIAYDSLVTCNGVVVYKDYEKCLRVDGVTFIISGHLVDYAVIINNWFSPETKKSFEGRAFVVDEQGILFQCGSYAGKIWKEKIERSQHVAIGSGRDFALMAMDLGLTAEDAVRKTSERCIYTGGQIRTFKLP